MISRVFKTPEDSQFFHGYKKFSKQVQFWKKAINNQEMKLFENLLGIQPILIKTSPMQLLQKDIILIL